jgi:hypothetical protein
MTLSQSQGAEQAQQYQSELLGQLESKNPNLFLYHNTS